MKRLLLVLVIGLGFAVPAQAEITGPLPRQVKRALRYLPKDGRVVHYDRASRRITHVKMVESVRPGSDFAGLPGAEWVTVYTVRFAADRVAVCIGGMGVIERFPRRAGR